MMAPLRSMAAALALAAAVSPAAWGQAYQNGQFQDYAKLNAADLNAAFANYLPLTGGAMKGPLLLQADPTANTQAATKQYVDARAGGGGGAGTMGAQNANAVAITGGSITGLAAFGVSNASTVAMTGGPPNWASLTTSYDNVRVTLGPAGTCPQTQDFGGNTVGLASALVGCVSVPTALTSPDASFGLVGYADSASTRHGAVGVGGFANTDADSGQAWGGNVLTSNCKQRLCTGGNDGTTNATLYGLEIDANIDATTGGASPNALLRGLWITGATTIASANPDVTAIEVGPLGINMTPHIPWPSGLVFEDGATSNAIAIGTSSAGNGFGSQNITFDSRTTGGALNVAAIATDANNNLSLTGAASYVFSAPVLTPVKTVATLAACNAGLSGARSSVTDATAPTFLGALTGGGTVHTPVFCNGTAWVAG